jgi:hypothetical protein
MKLEQIGPVDADGNMPVEYSLDENDVRQMLESGDPEAREFVSRIMDEELKKRFPDGYGVIDFAGYVWGKFKLRTQAEER